MGQLSGSRRFLHNRCPLWFQLLVIERIGDGTNPNVNDPEIVTLNSTSKACALSLRGQSAVVIGRVSNSVHTEKYLECLC